VSAQSSHTYEKYFRTFLGNRERGQRYQLVLLTEVICGIPSAVAEGNDAGHFDVAMDTGTVRQVAWERLLSASQIG
jgi:hypothetical protein